MFKDRLQVLCGQVGFGSYSRDPRWRPHQVMDALDETVGIRTRHGSAKAYTQGAVPFPQSEYVGARLARLERHVTASKTPRYFWLGAGDKT